MQSSVSVLLIAANADDAALLGQQLSAAANAQCEVVVATSLEQAREAFTVGEFDALVLDLTMPSNQIALYVSQIRAIAESVPLIVITKHQGSDSLRAMSSGADGFISRADLEQGVGGRVIVGAMRRGPDAANGCARPDRYAFALEGSGDGLWDWDLVRDVVHYSPRWGSLLGLPEREVVAGPQYWFDRVHPDDITTLRGVLAAHLEGGSRRFEYEHRLRGAGGDFQWVQIRGLTQRDATGAAQRMAGSMTDISVRKETEQQLVYHALHDHLTGLANRVLLMDRLGVALAALRRRRGPHFGVLFLDVDRFKVVNDSFGHATGDRLLIAIARRLEGFLRPADTLARLGGDEFAIILSDVDDVKAAVHVAERIRELLSHPFEMNGHQLEVTASVGIALSTSGYEEPADILNDADIAMYRAKSVGSGSCQVFDRELHQSAVALLRMEAELRRALEHNEFILHFQPVVSLERGQVVGFEGLLRWRHPERGILGPSRFMAIAEESGLIVSIDWWALEEACRQLRSWQDEFVTSAPDWLAVNVSRKLLAQPDVVERLLEIVDGAGVRRNALRLELAESALMEKGEQAIAKLIELRDLGFHVTVDDFGTECLSLGLLNRFRYDALKIDPSFVSGLASDSPAMVKTILSVAENLGIGVIAEGVETVDQVRRLRQLHCPEGQGFWFARPADAAASAQLLCSAPSWWSEVVN